MIPDGSRFIHGWLYHFLYDRALDEARQVVIDLVPRGASVLDIACGTGELCSALRVAKDCRVVGVDLSRRMLDFAKAHSRYGDVTFVHGDATNLTGMEAGEFDCATMLFLIHELHGQERVRALNEALRVARRVIVVDSFVPLPRNAHAMALHAVEASGGRVHYSCFASYLAAGGIMGIVANSNIMPVVLHRSVFWHGCRDVVVFSRQGSGESV